jgi:hypothetical protein
MENNMPNRTPDQDNDFFASLQATGSDFKVQPPRGFWQRFWHNTGLRVALGVVLLLAMLAGLLAYFLYVYQSSSQTLTDYVPGAAWLYLEFNFDAQEWQELQRQAPDLAAATNDFFIRQGLSQEIIDQASRIVLVGTLDDGQLAWTWLLKTPQPRLLEPFLKPGTYLRQPGTQVAAVSLYAGAIKDFVYLPGRPAAEYQPGSLWYGFVRPAELAGYFSDKSGRNLALAFLGQKFTAYKEPLLLSISRQQDYLRLAFGKEGQATVVWPEFVSAYDLVLRNVNPAKALNSLEGVMEGQPLLQFFWQQMQERSASELGLNWFSLYKFLDRPAALALTSRSELPPPESLSDHPLKIDDYELIINLESPEAGSAEFAGSLIRGYMSRRWPGEVARTLPDGSRVYDLVVDMDQWQFTADPAKSGWQTIHAPGHGLGFTLWNSEDFLALANDPEIPSLRLSGPRETDFHCALPTSESLYLGRKVLSEIPLLQNFRDLIVSFSPDSLAFCLR